MDEAEKKAAAETAKRIGGNIRRFRETAGLSPTDLAGLAGMTIQYLWRVENGVRSVASVRTVERLAVALGVPVCKLIDPPPPEPKKRKGKA